ncbi:cyclin-dependent kinase 1-like [Branchiostoma floridae x Branchiostoma belcheri]
MERYRILEELGQGAFGKVYKAERKDDDSALALKCLTVDSLDEGQVVMREIRALQQAVGKHPHILQYTSVFAEDIGLNTPVLTVCLVVEYCNGDTLDSFILKDKPSRATVLQLLCDTAEGVAYLHGRNVVHGALKPDNIMVDNSGQRPVVKIADFGLVRVRELGQCGDVNTYFATMIMYRSPELLLNMLAQRELVTNTTMADVFALGLIIAAILGQTTDSTAPSTDPATQATDPADPATDSADPGTDPATDPTVPGKLVPAVYVDGKRLSVAGAMIRYPEFPVADMLMPNEPQGSPLKALVVSMLGVYPHQRPTSEQVLGRLRQITGSSGG